MNHENNSTPVYVFGAGNGGTMWAEIARDAGIEIAGFLDDQKAGVMRPADAPKDIEIIPAIFDNAIRLNLANRFRCKTVIHPKAFVYTSASIGSGTLIKPLAMIGARCQVGRNVIIDSSVSVEHDSRIGDGVYISVGSSLGSSVEIGERALIGINCTIQSGVRIGAGAIVSSGSVVLTHVEAGKIIKARV